MSLIATVVFFVSFFIGKGSLNAQTVLMPVSGHADTVMCYAELFDDGGSSAPHANFCNASYTFHTVNPTGHYRIEVISDLTHPQGNALLQIKNGDTPYSSTLCTFPGSASGSGLYYFSSSNAVTIVFNADDDFPTSGFEVILCEYDNLVPSGLSTGFLDSNTIFLSWYATMTPVTWVLDYALVDSTSFGTSALEDSNSFQTLVTDTNYLVFPNVPVGYRLVYRIYSFDTSASSICPRSLVGVGQPYTPPAPGCPCRVPSTYQVTDLGDSIRFTWTTDSVVSVWHIVVVSMGIDTFFSNPVLEFTFPYNNPCNLDWLMINGDCGYETCNRLYAPLPVGGCHSSVGSISLTQSTGHSISLSWGHNSNPGLTNFLYCRKSSAPSGSETLIATLPYDTTTYEVTGLDPCTSYYFLIRTLCTDSSFSCNPASATFMTTLDDCIDYINLSNNNHVRRTWGTYSNPQQSFMGPAGRHVAIIDTSLRDHNTGNLLRCIPVDEIASIRLGDENIGAQGETITFDYFVDSLDKDMLVLKYAVVLQNSNHTSVNQPRFTMEILDSNEVAIDTTCCYADFYAAGDLGWNSVSGSNVIWKDWSTVGIDIAPYHGQLIKIRFTTKDCADGGHFGYAYFTIHCDSKRIDLYNYCENEDSVRLRAPLGFDYRWYRGNDTTVISTESEILVRADSTAYFCQASFIGKPECGFTVHSLAVLPVPSASMYYELDTCAEMLHLYSNCKIKIDEAFLPYVHQTIDNLVWIVEGDTLYGDSLAVPLEHNGICHLALFCSLSESFCTDSTFDSVVVDFVHRTTLVGDTVACYGDTVVLHAEPTLPAVTQLQWNDSLSGTDPWLVIDGDREVTLVANAFSCSDTLRHRVRMFPHYDDTLYVDACPGTVDTLGFRERQTGVYTHFATDRNGCDSLYSLNLTVHPAYYDTVRAATCDEGYVDSEFNEDSTGFYTHAYTTVWGCDSLRHLDFVRHVIWNDTLQAEILFGETYDRFGFNESEEGFYEMLYTDVYGCDSIRNLDLTVIWLRFPNAVTPNGDGYNDRMEIPDLLRAKIFDYNCLWIYDRWGRLIYKKENIHREEDFWDPNKTNTPDGTYFYRFFTRANGQVIDHKSAIEVIR